ncbi:RNA polymerase III transcription factor IIIC subunit-domain-containing protein [Mycena albidolilacea]|uniref:RNA polymerase III transcription factor IIIC subunit-domain-containing protein n=1 Tax=Mycena albidolilacea TaxID=1033008 RepID=A0AAD7AU47_9AGAR|nr:RNA polymerase III transcription factor IIIC subunit-domain-containing protein [Mycena albidolilacea]
MEGTAEPEGSSSVSVSVPAQQHPINATPFYSIEYPGYVRTTSVPIAVQNLGGQTALGTAFKRSAGKTEAATLELKLRPGNPFAHPIPGDVVPTNNLVLKLVKRKRKNRIDTDDGAAQGEYTAEIVGTTTKTVRFRSMADYQYQPDMNDPVTKLRAAMDNMDVEAIRTYVIPPEKADYMVPAPKSQGPDIDMNLDPELTGIPHPEPDPGQPMRSNLRLFPPPLFSRQAVPQSYNFKSNPASIVSTTVNEETGEEKKRLINKMRWKGYGPISITFTERQIPDKPSQNILEVRNQISDILFDKLTRVFSERPVWTRGALFNQFTAVESRDILNSKPLLPMVCYVFSDGPWRDTLIRFGYDPRKNPDARFYQRLYFRNANHPILKPSVMTRRQDRTAANMDNWAVAIEDGSERDNDRRKSHQFDGKTLTKETASFQLCDLIDPMLKEMIDNSEELREECDERDGWYPHHALERIKTVVRHKFFSVLEGYLATDEECRQLLLATEKLPSKSAKDMSSLRSVRLHVGKHNMAKGAMRPEDAAALRLRAALDKARGNRAPAADD